MDSVDELVLELKDKITPNVYFSPGDDITLKYPCIVINRTGVTEKSANNTRMYMGMVSYNITYMTRDLEYSVTKQMLRSFTYCDLSSYFISNGIAHEAFTLYWRV